MADSIRADEMPDDVILAIWQKAREELQGVKLTPTQVKQRLKRDAIQTAANEKHRQAVETDRPLIDAAIEVELRDDPENMGYDGKTDKEVCAMFNDPRYEKNERGENVGRPIHSSRANVVLAGLAGAPNAITPDDLERVRGG